MGAPHLQWPVAETKSAEIQSQRFSDGEETGEGAVRATVMALNVRFLGTGRWLMWQL